MSPAMNCANVKRYLALYLDSELGPETTFEITSHLEECADCRRVAALEERLETRIRESLMRPHPDDDALWSRSVKQFKRSLARGRKSVIALAATGFVVATTAVILWFTGIHWVHDELDLAEATAAAHARQLRGESDLLTQFDKASEVDEYFHRQLSPAYCLNIDTASSMSLLGGSVCEVGKARAAHVMCADSTSTLSLFWLSSDQIDEFPETVSRFEKYGSSFHCHVDPYEFFVKNVRGGFVVGIGQIPPPELEAIVNEATSLNCGRAQ